MENRAEIVLDGKESAEEITENERLADLSKKFIHRLPSQIIYHGMLLNKVVDKDGITKLLELQLQKDDVVICGYPRSGTTWLGEILSLILSDIDIEYIKNTMCYSRVLWIDDKRSHKHIQTTPQGPRLLKTHLPARLFMPLVKRTGCKCVTAFRNPKDVAVSWYFLYKSFAAFGEYSDTFSEWLPMFMSGYVQMGDWFSHTNEWFEAVTKEPNNIIPVFYEELQNDPHTNIKNISSSLGKSFTDEQIDAIVQATSFEKMKSNPMSNLSHLKSVKLPFIREGKICSWMKHFNEEENSKFTKLMEERIKDQTLFMRLTT